MITRADLDVTLTTSKWDSDVLTVTFDAEIGWTKLSPLTLVSMKGFEPAVTLGQGGGFFLYRGEVGVGEFIGVFETYDASRAIDELVEWLNDRVVAQRVAGTAYGLRDALTHFDETLSPTSPRDFRAAWQEVLDAAVAVTALIREKPE